MEVLVEIGKVNGLSPGIRERGSPGIELIRPGGGSHDQQGNREVVLGGFEECPGSGDKVGNTDDHDTADSLIEQIIGMECIPGGQRRGGVFLFQNGLPFRFQVGENFPAGLICFETLGNGLEGNEMWINDVLQGQHFIGK